jgi:hypothetical protein
MVAERDRQESALAGGSNVSDRHQRRGRGPGIDVYQVVDGMTVANRLARAIGRTDPAWTRMMRARK